MESSGDDETLTKLEFTIDCSSADAAYPGQELLQQSPDTRGWQSAKYCAYPQELLLRFNSFVQVKQIQLLCHEFKICSRAEISVGVIISESDEGEQIDWKKLGSLSFDSNERSGFLARELKSVHVTSEGDVLKLRLFNCHKNKLNTCNQIGIVAVNALGKVLDTVPPPELNGSSQSVARGPAVTGQPGDTSFDQDLDPTTRRQYQKLQRLKEVAVVNEDYDEAKRLKVQLCHIRSIGERLASLEAKKRKAVEEEDYDLAKKLKEEIRQMKEGATQGRNDAELPSREKQSPTKNDLAAEASNESKSARGMAFKEIEQAKSQGTRAGGSDASAEVGPIDVADKMAVSLSFDRSKHEEYDDRVATGQGNYEKEQLFEASPVPSADDSQTATNAPQGFPSDLPAPEPLSAASAKAAHPLEQFAGEYIAQCFYSRSWQLREAALVYLRGNFDQLAQSGQERESLRLLCHVVAKGLKDKVANVFLASAAMTRSLVTKAATHSRDLQFATAEVVPLLVEKLGDTNHRIRDAAQESILMLARLKDSAVKNLTGLFVQPLKQKAAWRPVLGRLEMISELVELLGVEKGVSDGFDLDQLMQFVALAYTSPNADVRSAAISLTARIASFAGPHVKRYIPHDVNPKIREQLDREISVTLSSPRTQSTPTKATPNATKSDPRTPTSGSQLSPASVAFQSEAEDPSVFELELQKQEQNLGTDHPDLVEVLTNLATLYTHREEFENAYPLLKRVLDINETHFGCDHSNVAHALTDLAVLHMEQGQDVMGRPLLERALAIQEKNLGAEHPDVVAIRDVLTTGDE